MSSAGKREMVGKFMATNLNNGRVVYHRKHFAILSRNGSRDYRGQNYNDKSMGDLINAKDKVFTIVTGLKEYQYTTDDIGKMAYLIITNKWLDGAAKTEAKIIKRYINEALKEVQTKIKPRMF